MNECAAWVCVAGLFVVLILGITIACVASPDGGAVKAVKRDWPFILICLGMLSLPLWFDGCVTWGGLTTERVQSGQMKGCMDAHAVDDVLGRHACVEQYPLGHRPLDQRY